MKPPKWKNLMIVLGMAKKVLRQAQNGSSHIDKKLVKKLLNGEDYN